MYALYAIAHTVFYAYTERTRLTTLQVPVQLNMHNGIATLLAARCGCPICHPSVKLMKLLHVQSKLPKRLGLLTEELEK